MLGHAGGIQFFKMVMDFRLQEMNQLRNEQSHLLLPDIHEL